MGAFLVNFHVRCRSKKRVSESLRDIGITHAWVAGSTGKWVSFWEKEASTQDACRIQQLLSHTSKSLKSKAIAFLVHDSDVLCYWQYDRGEEISQYTSFPGYWGEETVDPEPLSAKCKLLTKCCRSGTKRDQLESILAQSSRTDPDLDRFPMVELRLQQLAPLLEIAEAVLLTDYGDINVDVSPAELGATSIGLDSDHESDSDSSDDDFDFGSWLARQSPLFGAVFSRDIAAIEKLVADGHDINECPRGSTTTALGLAISYGTVELVRLLIALGADPNQKPPAGETPLRQATGKADVEMMRILAEAGADVNECHPETASLLHMAIFHHSFKIIPTLLAIGVDPTLKNPNALNSREFVAAYIETTRGTITKLKASVPGKSEQACAVLFEQIDQLKEIHRLLEPPPTS